MSTVIKVENLSKKYLLSHQRKERYLTLRDTIANNVRALGRRICSPSASSTGKSRGGKTTEEFWALKDVCFEVRQGDRIGIIGRNGAGKSTLLKILSRITEPTKGRVSIKGRVASLLEVGTGFHPELTGRENIFLNGAIMGMSRVEILGKFDEIVAFAEVEKFLDTPVKRYSSGMYVRLAFAVAAHLEPEILIVDEVLAVGDAQFQKKCLGKMEEVGNEGRTVLFVSHNMVAIERLCNRAIMLDKGCVLMYGEVPSVVSGYLNEMTTRSTDTAGPLARSLDGAVELLSVRVTDASGRPLSGTRCGEDMNLEIVVRSETELESVLVSVGINDTYGTRIALLHTGMSGFPLPLRRGLQSFVCLVGKVPISPGIFWLDVKLAAQGDAIIMALQCVSLEVGTGDYHGTGRLPDRAWDGVVQLPQKWKSHVLPQAISHQPLQKESVE